MQEMLLGHQTLDTNVATLPELAVELVKFMDCNCRAHHCWPAAHGDSYHRIRICPGTSANPSSWTWTLLKSFITGDYPRLCSGAYCPTIPNFGIGPLGLKSATSLRVSRVAKHRPDDR